MAKVKGIWLKTKRYIECDDFEFQMYVDSVNKKKSLKQLNMKAKQQKGGR